MSSTIHDLREHYLAGNKRITWSTAQLTERSFSYLLGAIGNMELKYMTIEHAEQFQLWLLNRYAKTTVNIYMKIIRPAFRYAMRRRWLKDDIFAVPLIKVTEERERIYEPQEIERILESSNQTWRLRIVLAYLCGMRRAEVLNLNFSDCDFTRMLIHIQPKKETHRLWWWEPKGRTCRTLPMPDEAEDLLRAQRVDLPIDQPYTCLSEIRYFRVNQLKRKGQLSERVRLCPDENFSKPFKLILRRANVADGTFHDLRRTYGTMMAEAGIPQHELAYLMGHNDSKTTERYYIKLRQRHVIERARGVALVKHKIGATRFERATLAPPARCSGQAELRPEQTILSNGA
jgi:integrase